MGELTFNLTTDDRQYENMVSLLNKILEQQEEIKESVEDLKEMRNAEVNNIMFDNITLAIILEVSDSTLYRWRHAEESYRIPFERLGKGRIYYNFDDVLNALYQGRLIANGFDQQKAINNMIQYRKDRLGVGSLLKAKKQL